MLESSQALEVFRFGDGGHQVNDFNFKIVFRQLGQVLNPLTDPSEHKLTAQESTHSATWRSCELIVVFPITPPSLATNRF